MKTPFDYVWIDSKNRFRWKTRILDLVEIYIKFIPEWNYDGSSCGQADDDGQTEVILKPVFMMKDPFRYYGYTVYCETYKDGLPLVNNTRYNANIIFEAGKKEVPWFGLEQEYYIFVCPSSGH